MSEELATQLLTAIFNNEEYIGPEELYIALFNGDPKDGGEEVDLLDYTRQLVEFSQPDGYSIQNINDVEFEPAYDDYGTVTHVAIMDASIGGNILFSEPLETPIELLEGVVIRIKAGHLVVNLS